MTVYEPPDNDARGITVRELLDDPGLELTVGCLAGTAGLDREVRHPRIQKSGLAMVGHMHGLVPTRIQILGETELSYAESLSTERQTAAARNLFSAVPACFLVTRGVSPPAPFLKEAESTGTPLLGCQETSSRAITAVHTLLDERLAPRARIHGVLVDVFEVGVLLLGRSGIGKSECALELVMGGHRLVADDAIDCDYRPPGMVFGQPAALLRHHIEVRGLGILNIKDLYGVTAIRERKRIDLIVRLEMWQADAQYDRMGLEDQYESVLGVPIRHVNLPVRPGRDMSAIIEIAARNELLRQDGHDTARELVERIEGSLLRPGPTSVVTKPGQADANESSAPPPVRPVKPK